MDKDYVTITVKTKFDNNTLKLTQDLSRKFDTGHYRYTIENKEGDILHAGYSICRAPKRVTYEKLAEIYKWATRDDE
jgi:hypothetical protein